MPKRLVSAFCWMMMIMFPGAVLAADMPQAMLYSSGTVTVNGKNISKTVALFPGDRIHTASDGVVTISSKGATILLPGDSSIIYGKTLDLGCASAVVNTTQGLGARLNGMTLTPVSSMAQYAVVQKGPQVEIAVRSGQLTVNDNGRLVTLASGKSLSVPSVCLLNASFQEATPAAPQNQASSQASAQNDEDLGTDPDGKKRVRCDDKGRKTKDGKKPKKDERCAGAYVPPATTAAPATLPPAAGAAGVSAGALAGIAISVVAAIVAAIATTPKKVTPESATD